MEIQEFARYVMFMVIGYLSGSVMYAWLIPLAIKKIDIRQMSDDGNPGTANAFKLAGVPCGVLVIACELLKAAVPVYLAAKALDTHRLLFAFVLAAPVLGHAFPVFLRGCGGKAIAASFGSLIGLTPVTAVPLWLLIFFYLLFSLVLVLNPHSLRTIATFICFTVGCLIMVPKFSVVLGSILISGAVIHRHLATYGGEKLHVAILNRTRYI